VQIARDSGAVARLQFALNTLAWTHLVASELTAAALMIDEDRVIAEATGNPPLGNARTTLAAWRGQEPQASELIEATLRESTARGLGRTVDFATYASAVLDNGLGRHAAAATRLGKRSSAISWGTGRLSCPSWPRRRRGPVTRPLSRRHWSGCPNARG
jgi:hypothetical protein